MAKKSGDGRKVVATNKKARFEYEILQAFEAGIELRGSEVKSLREGKASFVDCYASFVGDELYLHNLHISPYTNASPHEDYDPKRDRKLLLHRHELNRLLGQISQKGLTIVPLRIYFIRGIAKVEIGLARGKRLFDKRQTIKERDIRRETDREMRRFG